MAELSPRERRIACLFYAGNALATVGWWAVLWKVPASRSLFLGEAFGPHLSWIVVPDALAAVFGGLWVAVAVANRRKISGSLAWVHLGAAGYAWALTLSLTLFDPRSYWGLLAMSLSTSLSFAFAMRLNAARMLWGPFEFQAAEPGTREEYRKQTAKQITAMWLLFLAVIPVGIAGFECLVGWQTNWLAGAWRLPLALVLFGAAASLGLSSSFTMTRMGDGTPLPAACTRRLVVAGAYRFIRNPMALSGICQGVAVGLAIGSTLIMLYAVIGGLWWDILVRPDEEKHLLESFGDPFAKYKNEVPCWRPRLTPFVSE